MINGKTNDLPDPFNKLDGKDCVAIELIKGSSLFKQHDKATGLFYLVTGAIVLNRSTEKGDSVVLHRAKAGDTFAEASLFSEAYHCTATATCDSQIIKCKRPAVLALFDTDTEFARALLARFAFQVQTSRRITELLSIKNATDRIMAALDDGLLQDDISEFADTIGLAHATVYRGLSQLADNGKIQKTNRGTYQSNWD